MRRPSRPLGCIILATVASAIAFAQATPAQQTKPSSGLIAGRVVDGKNAPVEDAIVALRGPWPKPQPGIRETAPVRRVVVDAQGRFAFSGLPPGRYELAADQFGYTRGTPDESLELAENQQMRDASIVMTKLASISGRVTDEAGEPIVNVSVRALHRGWRNGYLSLRPASRAARTDDRGMYRIGTLTPGEYSIAVPARTSTFPVDVMRTALTSKVSLGVAETSRLGDVRNIQVSDHVLTTMLSAPIPPAPRDGALTVFQTTFYPGTVAHEDAESFVLQPGDERTNVDIRMQAFTTHRVAGRIIGPDGPIGLKPFQVLRSGGAAVSEVQDFEVATGITTSDGRFVVLGIPRGQFVIRLQTGEPAAFRTGDAPSLYANEPFSIGESDVTDLTVTARRLTVLNATIRMPASTARPPAFEVIIQSYGASAIRVFNPRVGADLRFSGELTPGRYLVIVHELMGPPCVSVSGGRTISSTLLVVDTQPTIDVSVTCPGRTNTTAELRGSVQDDSGRPRPRTRVVMFSTDRTRWSGDGYQPDSIQYARVNAQGTFVIANSQPGDYFVVAITEGLDDDYENPEFLARLTQGASKVSLGPGAKESITLRLQPIR